jgi:hypothetical protein
MTALILHLSRITITALVVACCLNQVFNMTFATACSLTYSLTMVGIGSVFADATEKKERSINFKLAA